MARKKEEKTFEEQLGQLELLVAQMEQGGLPLEEMIKAYEEGIKLENQLQKVLEETKGRLTLIQKKNGIEEELPLEGME